MSRKLRIVIFTAGEPAEVDRVLFERLANDPLLDLAAIVVDDYRPRPKPLLTRVVRAIREDGAGWVPFKVGMKVRQLRDGLIRHVMDAVHGSSVPPLIRPSGTFSPHAGRRATNTAHRENHDLLPLAPRSGERVAEGRVRGVEVLHVKDIHSDESIALIRSLSPDLGVIVGGRILRDSVIGIPALGTLNIHKRRLPEYRGGGPVGYWEILAGERSIGVSIHYATHQVDAGPVVAEASIAIEDHDTLESLALKAGLRGAQLYHEAIQRIACGDRKAVAQDLSRATTYRAPSEYKVWRLQQRLERALPKAQVRGWRRLRVIAQFLLLLPQLQWLRRKLEREHRAPIAIFFYHLVADRALNHMCLSFHEFVRQMEFLRRYYDVLPLDEAVDRLQSGSNDRVSAAITFDDGYRDNTWAIDYLRYFGMPATFFISIGHVRDGVAFEHDRRKGFDDAEPMTEADVRQLVADGFVIGSHAVHHEDFGTLDAVAADRVLRESRQQIEETCGQDPRYFAFPKGQRGVNITPDAFAAALQHYDAIFSAYGGYSHPERNRRHFLRSSNPTDLFEMNLAMSGYTGFRDCLAGNAWGRKTEKLDPCRAAAPGGRPPKAAVPHRIVIVAASPAILGGHSVQAEALSTQLRRAGREVSWLPIDVRFPRPLQWLRRVPVARTVLNQILYIPGLLRVARADVVHVFAASYWSFMLGPAPAIAAAKMFGKRVVLHYHSGEADDHLTRWQKTLKVLLTMADEIVVPSAYLQRVFAAHGYRARVIPNVVDPSRFRHRERETLRPRLLSVRNLEAIYKVENTIAAFALLKQRFPDATLTIAGYGSQEERLRRLASNLEGVTFLGRVERSDLPAVYDANDVFVNSSIVDNQPVSILEAFASGIPVVSTPAGDIEAMLRGGDAGLLVEPNDPAAMASAIERLIEEPALALRVAQCAHEELERYAASNVIPEWLALYDTQRSGDAVIAAPVQWNPETEI